MTDLVIQRQYDVWEADELEESEEDELTGKAFPQQLVTALARLVVSAAAVAAVVVTLTHFHRLYDHRHQLLLQYRTWPIFPLRNINIV